MTIYIDITQLEKGRLNTGIQRVIKEFLTRALQEQNTTNYKLLSHDQETNKTQLLQNKEVLAFLKDIQNFQFTKKTPIDLLTLKEKSILLEIDATWNAPIKRDVLYPVLKQNGFSIFNFIYDLTPILLPHYANEITLNNFATFLDAVYAHSDIIFTDSLSSQKDFLDKAAELNIKRAISTHVVLLGSDFFTQQSQSNGTLTQELLQKKYILFVGTLEPRKNQENLLNAFEDLAPEFPDLNLIFIGKQGWKSQRLAAKIDNHNLNSKQLFWLKSIDDNTLVDFYKNAFLVTYLSKYEGYGLPIAESLHYANITITQKNSSLYEVGKDFADYIAEDSHQALVEKIRFYINDKKAYKTKKAYIKANYQVTSWSMFYNSLHQTIISEYNHL